jgi:glycosyltransferase involved in cell wall biosynthesis
MKKFKVVGDPNNQSRFSSKIIIDSLNAAAKKLDLYSDEELIIVYDGCCNNHGYKVDAFICTYEICFPSIVLNNANKKPILGVSQDNKQFIIDGGHPEELTGYFPLGVDASLYPKIQKTKNKSQFVVGVYTESLVRGGIELCLESFITAFKDNKDVKLVIKDRNATDIFSEYIKNFSKLHNVNIEYENSHFNSIDKIIEWFSGIDCHLYMNRSSTWAMPPCESMTMGIPTIAVSYSGPREYIFHGKTGLEIDYTKEYVQNSLFNLIEIGCRNFFFTSGYKTQPTWAVGNTQKASELLIQLKNNSDLYKEISKNGREYAINNLTWENSAKKLHKELQKWYS